MRNDKYDIQELLQRDVYVNDKKVGKIVGERHHPNEARVRSMRLQVESDVADEFMRKPAELVPLPKELVHSIRNDGTVKLSKSFSLVLSGLHSRDVWFRGVVHTFLSIFV